MKRVLQVLSCLELGGTEAFVMSNYRQADKSKVQFDFLVFVEKDYPYLEEISSMGGRVFFAIPPCHQNLPQFLTKAIAIMREGEYDAVHSHVNVENSWVMLAAWIAGIKQRISHSHDTTGMDGSFVVRCYRRAESLMIKLFATDWLACSADAGRYLYGPRFFNKSGRVIPNGISSERFSAVSAERLRSLRKAFDIPDDCGLILGNITRFEEKKNQLFLVDIFSELLTMRQDAILLLGGPDGGLESSVRARVAQLGLSSSVRFIGQRDDIAECLGLIDVYLFPSLYEGFGIVLLEAQAAGCFCIASTGVSKEVDMGLGLVRFVDIDLGAKEWANIVLDSPGKCPLQQRFANCAVIKERGYGSEYSTGLMLGMYEKHER